MELVSIAFPVLTESTVVWTMELAITTCACSVTKSLGFKVTAFAFSKMFCILY
jgi:hypothetical protein